MNQTAKSKTTNERLIELMESATPLADEGTEKKFRFKSVFTGASPRQVNGSLDFILGEWRGMAVFVEELLTTGSSAARELARDCFSEVVNGTAKTIDDMDNDPDWDHMIPRNSDIRGSMLKGWNIGSIADECGITYDRKTLRGVSVAAGFLASKSKTDPDLPDEIYWRGVAVLALSQDVEVIFSGTLEDGGKFIAWAGERKDIKEVMAVVRERGVLNPETLEGLLDQENIEKPLRDGLL